MIRKWLVPVACAAVLSAGCFEFMKPSSSSSSTVSVNGLSGSWSSVGSGASLVNACTDFKWAITTITDSTGSGTFSAVCFGTLNVTGSASGTLSGTTVAWTATATGTAPGGVNCPISLSGTANYDGTQIRVPYSGTTCLGPVSGTEVLRK